MSLPFLRLALLLLALLAGPVALSRGDVHEFDADGQVNAAVECDANLPTDECGAGAGLVTEAADTSTTPAPPSTSATEEHRKPIKRSSDKGSKAKKVKKKTKKKRKTDNVLIGSGALFVAIENGHDSTARTLCNAGAHIEGVHQESGLTPLLVAASLGHVNIVEWLVNDFDADLDAGLPDTSALYLAAKHGHTQVVTTLLTKFNFDPTRGPSALHAAAEEGHFHVANALLLSKKFDINKRRDPDNASSTPLFLAVHNNRFAMIKLLCLHNADISLVDHHQETLLHASARTGDASLVHMLPFLDSNLNAQNRDGETGLFIACVHGDDRTAQAILSKGADMDLARHDGVTPRVAAEGNGHTAVVRVLDEHREQQQVADDLVKWVLEAGANLDKGGVQHLGNGFRGVLAKEAIHTGELVAAIPRKCMITGLDADASEIGQLIHNSGVEVGATHSIVAAYLLQERDNPDSFFQPFLKNLPKSYAFMPLFYGNEDLKHLEGSFTVMMIAHRHKALRKEYDNIAAAVPEFAKWSYEEFVWGRLVVITRTFGMTVDGKKTHGLVPYADLLNHRLPKETTWKYDQELEAFTLTAITNINQGAQVYDSYGRKCNSRFFVNYGFTLENNELDNQAMLAIHLHKDAIRYEEKLRMVGGNPRVPMKLAANYDEKHGQKLFSLMRWMRSDSEEFDILLEYYTDPMVKLVEPYSIRNEIEVLQLLKESAWAALAKFPQTLEQDIALLKAGVNDANYRNCIVMRKGEKEVLHWYHDLATKALPLLELPWNELAVVKAGLDIAAGSGDPRDAFLRQYLETAVFSLVEEDLV